MFDKLENVEKRYEELNAKISDPEVIANQNEWKKLMKEHADIEEIVEKYREYSELFEEDLFVEISLETCVSKRISAGGTGPDSVEKQIEYVEKFI